jgi:hypothetical protein
MLSPIARVLGVLVVAALLAPSALAITSVGAQTTTGARYFADDAFKRIWERNDRPVELVQTDRSWTWGPNSSFNGSEPYKQSPYGRRLVQYFDKARMEINNPNKDRDDFDYVTNGLLVREMVSGNVALGDLPDEVEKRSPSEEPVAGDPSNVNTIGPTYGDFREIASLANDHPATNRIGQPVKQTFNNNSQIGELTSDMSSLAAYSKIAVFEPILKHNIPDKFWTFITQTGPVWENNKLNPQGSLFPRWEFYMGLPITEPYWVRTKVSGVERAVMVQLFERRVLTYTPTNRPGFEVEMGNVGQHYYKWRYGLNDTGTTVTPGDDGSRPKILDLERSGLTATTARIQWTTNIPTTSRISYGLTQDLGTSIGQTAAYITEHDVSISGLTPSTVYYFRIMSQDQEGRIVDDTMHSFKTLA